MSIDSSVSKIFQRKSFLLSGILDFQGKHASLTNSYTFIYLFRIISMLLFIFICTDGTSVIKAKAEVRAPRLHYIHPTCFEAGKPMEFFACGSNLLQPKFRYYFLSGIPTCSVCRSLLRCTFDLSYYSGPFWFNSLSYEQ